MADLVSSNVPAPSADLWIHFNGFIESMNPKTATLVPFEDKLVKLLFDRRSVWALYDKEAATDVVLVRRGSKLLSLDIDKKSPFKSLQVGLETELCPEGSKCIGNMELCCLSNVAVGGCNGYWRCPGD